MRLPASAQIEFLCPHREGKKRWGHCTGSRLAWEGIRAGGHDDFHPAPSGSNHCGAAIPYQPTFFNMTSSEAASTARESLCSLRRRNSSRTYHARSSGVSRSRQALDCTQPGQGRHRDCWCEFSLLEKPRCTIVSSPPPGWHFSTRNDRPCRDEGKPVLQAAPLLIHTTTSLSSAGRVTTIATAQQPGDPDRSSPHRSGALSKCTD